MSEKLEEKISRQRFKKSGDDIKKNDDKPVNSTIRFKNTQSRQEVENFCDQKNIKSLNDLFMTLLKLAMHDELVQARLEEEIKQLNAIKYM